MATSHPVLYYQTLTKALGKLEPMIGIGPRNLRCRCFFPNALEVRNQKFSTSTALVIH
jgi:hypothetical protein